MSTSNFDTLSQGNLIYVACPIELDKDKNAPAMKRLTATFEKYITHQFVEIRLNSRYKNFLESESVIVDTYRVFPSAEDFNRSRKAALKLFCDDIYTETPNYARQILSSSPQHNCSGPKNKNGNELLFPSIHYPDKTYFDAIMFDKKFERYEVLYMANETKTNNKELSVFVGRIVDMREGEQNVLSSLLNTGDDQLVLQDKCKCFKSFEELNENYIGLVNENPTPTYENLRFK